jgi:predicted hydrocarbon binding protein
MGTQLDLRDIRRRVLNVLEDSPSGLTTMEIGERLGINRMTMAKYLEMLQLTGAIKRKKISSASLWYVPKEVAIIKGYVRSSIQPLVKSMLRGEKTPTTLWDELELMLFKVSRMGLSVNGTANYVFYEIGENISNSISDYIEGETLEEVLENTREVFRKLGISALEVIQASERHAIITLRGHPACSGMPVVNAPLCHIEVGLLAGIIGRRLGESAIEEIRCLGLRDKACQFNIQLRKEI